MSNEDELYVEFLGFAFEDKILESRFIIHGDHPKHGIPVDYKTLKSDGINIPSHMGVKEWVQHRNS